jgi:hypothetical protein
MKTGDSEAISHIWQLAHLKHYFGRDLAIKSIDSGHTPSIVDQRTAAPSCGAFTPKRPSVTEVCSKPVIRLSS